MRKALIVIGCILLTLEALFVIGLAVTKNMGDDAAGRGMATGFATILAPVVLLAAALFWWGARDGPAVAFWAGLLIAFTPVLFGVQRLISSTATDIGRARARAEEGKFDDKTLTAIARAIDAADLAKLQQLLATSKPDWKARERRDRTILGYAIVRATDYGADTTLVQAVRLLLEAGAPATTDAIAPARSQASVSEWNLVYHLYGIHNPSALAVLDLVLAAGLSPNTVDEDDRPIYFSTYTVLPALEILDKHGADFTRLDPRIDRLKYNALMNAVSLQMWESAKFFLDHGLSPDYTAPDGQSTRTIFASEDRPGTAYYGADATAHAAFLEALKTVR